MRHSEVKSLEEPAAPFVVKTPIFLINRSFGFFWVGQSISTLGSQVTAFAIPLLAALSLHATAQQMGFLRAAEFAPFLILTLPAGVWADLGIRIAHDFFELNSRSRDHFRALGHHAGLGASGSPLCGDAG